jgi:hypothetical protein
VRTQIPEKLLRIADEIEEKGEANLTRLTVLKKWFDRPYRLASFAVFVANRASGRKGKTIGEAAELFHEARALLSKVPILDPVLELKAAEQLHGRLKTFQDEHKKVAWGSVRMVKNHNLFLIEEGLRIYLWSTGSPSDGYRLAVNYCEHYDPRYGNSLNGPSLTKLHEIVRFMFTIEALEDHQSEGG